MRIRIPDARSISLLCCLLAGVALLSGQKVMAGDQLPPSVQAILDQWDVPGEAVSVLVQARGDASPRLRVNAETPRNPASVMKLFTTYAALEALGPGHTWETRVHAGGPVRAGRLQGDLWFEGGGDPFLTAEDFWGLLGSVRRRGIAHIDGDLVFDNSRFAAAERDPGAFDNRPYHAYNQPPHPLLVNLNAIKFELESLQTGDGVRVSMHPPLGNLPVENRLRADPSVWCGAYRWHVDYRLAGDAGAPLAVLEGRQGAGCGPRRLHRAGLPVETYVHGLFDALWTHWGGEFSGSWRTGTWANVTADPLARHQSRPLSAVVQTTNKYSNNVMARQLALSIAAEQGNRPASEADGRAAVMDVLRRQGLALEGFQLDEVAGLSRDNRITVEHVAELLDHAHASLVMPEFLASLPVAGVDGTLRNRFRGEPEAGRIRAKTGSINHVSGIGGYVRNLSDETLMVAVLINHQDAHRGSGTAIQNAVLRWAFNHGSDDAL